MVHFMLAALDTREDLSKDPQQWGKYLLARCVRNPNATPIDAGIDSSSADSGDGGSVEAGRFDLRVDSAVMDAPVDVAVDSSGAAGDATTALDSGTGVF